MNVAYKSNGHPKRENQTIVTSLGELVYLRDWEAVRMIEGIANYYGAEHTRSHRGDEPITVMAQILDQLFTVGDRIWLNGTEHIKKN